MTNEKKTRAKEKKAKKKFVLYDLVNESDKDYSILVGCLVEAGLYQQYLKETVNASYNLKNKATITKDEFEKITKLLD